MSIVIKPSKPFSSGTEYEIFMYSFCSRCKHGKVNKNGFPEYPENGGCKIWDAMENARFDASLFPASDLARIEVDGKVKYFHICKGFETDDSELMQGYRALFGEEENTMKLIDVQSLLKQIEAMHTVIAKKTGYSEMQLTGREIMKIIDVAPEVEAEPVRHGHWIETNEGTFCSECNKNPIDVGEHHICNYSAPYCPNCGAKMDAGGA